MESREVFVSPRHGELWSADVRAVSDAQVVAVDVVVLAAGSLPVATTLSVGRRWAGRGWHPMIECPRCRCISSVLHVLRGELLCRRCGPRLTVGQREHKNRSWTEFDGALEARLLRCALRGRNDETCANAGELLGRDAGRVEAALAGAREFIEACDAVMGECLDAEATQVWSASRRGRIPLERAADQFDESPGARK